MAPTARSAQGAPLVTAAGPGATAAAHRSTVAWDARLDLETVMSPLMSRLTAGVVPSTARPAPGPPLATAVRRAATVAVPLTTAALGVSPPLAPAIVVVVPSRRMAGVVRTGRLARGRTLEPVVPRTATAETRQTIVVPGVRPALAPAVPSRVMASVARMARHVRARPSGPAARSPAIVEAAVPTVVSAARAAPALAPLQVVTLDGW